MTHDAWMSHYSKYVAGLALFGHCDSMNKGPLERAASAMAIPAEVQGLLKKMWDDAQPAKVEPHKNGTFPPKVVNVTKAP